MTATKTEITKDIRDVYGPSGYLTSGQVAEYTNRHINDVKRYMSGYKVTPKGRAKLYHVLDVADRISKDGVMS